ncbi:MAG TPA: peptide-methionine (R)-S-oxide reductase MsrB [Candidatus Bathyarchaeia archaeon]|nr:peptide-methionine (R)-S-oxide reductase MsrB [Candidatus Bathyarchaeia archaeon]
MEKIRKTDEEWKKILTPEQYKVMREHGTETPFSCVWGKLGEGTYHCAACHLPLFRSDSKFESGTGWPSYYEPVSEDHLECISDITHGMERTEVRCARCESHLGHVFDDGPLPTQKRYCINSVALNFFPKKNEKK